MFGKGNRPVITQLTTSLDDSDKLQWYAPEEELSTTFKYNALKPVLDSLCYRESSSQLITMGYDGSELKERYPGTPEIVYEGVCSVQLYYGKMDGYGGAESGTRVENLYVPVGYTYTRSDKSRSQYEYTRTDSTALLIPAYKGSVFTSMRESRTMGETCAALGIKGSTAITQMYEHLRTQLCADVGSSSYGTRLMRMAMLVRAAYQYEQMQASVVDGPVNVTFIANNTNNQEGYEPWTDADRLNAQAVYACDPRDLSYVAFLHAGCGGTMPRMKARGMDTCVRAHSDKYVLPIDGASQNIKITTDEKDMANNSAINLHPRHYTWRCSSQMANIFFHTYLNSIGLGGLHDMLMDAAAMAPHCADMNSSFALGVCMDRATADWWPRAFTDAPSGKVTFRGAGLEQAVIGGYAVDKFYNMLSLNLVNPVPANTSENVEVVQHGMDSWVTAGDASARYAYNIMEQACCGAGPIMQKLDPLRDYDQRGAARLVDMYRYSHAWIAAMRCCSTNGGVAAQMRRGELEYNALRGACANDKRTKFNNLFAYAMVTNAPLPTPDMVSSNVCQTMCSTVLAGTNGNSHVRCFLVLMPGNVLYLHSRWALMTKLAVNPQAGTMCDGNGYDIKPNATRMINVHSRAPVPYIGADVEGDLDVHALDDEGSVRSAPLSDAHAAANTGRSGVYSWGGEPTSTQSRRVIVGGVIVNKSGSASAAAEESESVRTTAHKQGSAVREIGLSGAASSSNVDETATTAAQERSLAKEMLVALKKSDERLASAEIEKRHAEAAHAEQIRDLIKKYDTRDSVVHGNTKAQMEMLMAAHANEMMKMREDMRREASVQSSSVTTEMAAVLKAERAKLAGEREELDRARKMEAERARALERELRELKAARENVVVAGPSPEPPSENASLQGYTMVPVSNATMVSLPGTLTMRTTQLSTPDKNDTDIANMKAIALADDKLVLYAKLFGKQFDDSNHTPLYMHVSGDTLLSSVVHATNDWFVDGVSVDKSYALARLTAVGVPTSLDTLRIVEGETAYACNIASWEGALDELENADG